MHVMLLAAGRGTRLGELGQRVPKALVEVDQRPLLAHQLDWLASQGAERVIVNAHHLAEQIIGFVEGTALPLPVEVVVEPELLGSAGGLRNALARFPADRPIVVVNGDTLLDASLADLCDAHRRTRAAATIAAIELDDTTGKGVLDVDPDARVLRLLEKPPSHGPGLANAGLYVLERDVIELLEVGTFGDLALDLVPLALERRLPVYAHRIADALDLGTRAALSAAQPWLDVRGARAAGNARRSAGDMQPTLVEEVR